MRKLQTALAMRIALAGLATPTLKRDEGQTFVEYAMILALIGVVVAVVLTFLGNQIGNAYSDIAGRI
jgi:Flp pilus assembly pilin Flp